MDLPALQWLQECISSRAGTAFLRMPVTDRFCSHTFDLDLVVFGEVESFRPQRIRAPDGTPLDLAWYPDKLLTAPESLAQSGLAAHRLQCSELLWDGSGQAANCRQAFDRCFYQPPIQAKRIGVFLDMGYLTVREIGVTWDFPALALFWLHMGHAACVAAIADAVRLACPNVFTRPFGYVDDVERATGLEIRREFIQALQLESDPLACIEPLRRIHRAVSARYSHPSWPAPMRQATRAEYEYTLPAAELEWRIDVAREMAGNGFPEAALYYLRFWAYSLARLPMVWHRAAEGQDIAFLRPERAVRPDLEKHCPEILPDLTTVLGGQVSVDGIHPAIENLARLRSTTLSLLRSRGITPPEAKDWRPHRPQTPTPA